MFTNQHHQYSFKVFLTDAMSFHQYWPYPNKWGTTHVKAWAPRHHFHIATEKIDELALHGSVLPLLKDEDLLKTFHVQDPLERIVILSTIGTLCHTNPSIVLNPLQLEPTQELGLFYPEDVRRLLLARNVSYPELDYLCTSKWLNGSLILVAASEPCCNYLYHLRIWFSHWCKYLTNWKCKHINIVYFDWTARSAGNIRWYITWQFVNLVRCLYIMWNCVASKLLRFYMLVK